MPQLNEHQERLLAMLDDTRHQTWDLSPNDTSAIRWIVDTKADLLASLIETRNAAAAMLCAITESGHGYLIDSLPKELEGFGTRANAAIARATLPNPPESR